MFSWTFIYLENLQVQLEPLVLDSYQDVEYFIMTFLLLHEDHMIFSLRVKLPFLDQPFSLSLMGPKLLIAHFHYLIQVVVTQLVFHHASSLLLQSSFQSHILELWLVVHWRLTKISLSLLKIFSAALSHLVKTDSYLYVLIQSLHFYWFLVFEIILRPRQFNQKFIFSTDE